MAIDITSETFDEWIDFVFDHPVAEQPECTPEQTEQWLRDAQLKMENISEWLKAFEECEDRGDGSCPAPAVPVTDAFQNDASKEWYWHDEWEYEVGDAAKLVEYMTRLFSDPILLLARFTPEQLEQGFWFMAGCPGSMGVISDAKVSRMDREACVASMEHLFRKLFAVNPFDTICNMWWHLFLNNFGDVDEERLGDDEDAYVIRAMAFRTLGRILEIESHHCRLSALHGLGHLEHPGTEELVTAFLQRTPVDEETRAYALAAARGEVL